MSQNPGQRFPGYPNQGYPNQNQNIMQQQQMPNGQIPMAQGMMGYNNQQFPQQNIGMQQGYQQPYANQVGQNPPFQRMSQPAGQYANYNQGNNHQGNQYGFPGQQAVPGQQPFVQQQPQQQQQQQPGNNFNDPTLNDPSQGQMNNMINPQMNQQMHNQGIMPNHPVTQANQMNSGMNPMVSGSVNPQQPGMPNVQPGIAPVNSVNQTINQSRPSTPGQQSTGQPTTPGQAYPSQPPQEPSPPPTRPRNIFDELLEGFEDVFARLIAKDDMAGIHDKDEVSVGVEYSVNKFISKAQVVELYFNQMIAKQSSWSPQDVLTEEIKDLRAEIHRKDQWIDKMHNVAKKWATMVAPENSTKLSPKDSKDTHMSALETMSANPSYRKK